MKFFVTTLAFLCFQLIQAQSTDVWSSSKIQLEIQKLNTVGSVLYIAAHPDDENTRLLAYLVNERHLRTGYLSLTRGDGGQNLIGKEQGEALGLTRTHELLAARKIDGAEQFFTRANDFGFSKSPEETLKLWDKEQVLSDVVLTIRRFKPDVIICRFPTTGEGGHGHHTASAILAMEAFDAAADPTKFPEQLGEVQAWQAKRIFWNTFNFGGNNTTSEDQLKIDVGGYNPLLGLSYGEIAAMSRTMHKSQGFGTAMQRGENLEYFKFLKGDKMPKLDILEEIQTTWSRFPKTEEVQKLILDVIQNFNPQNPEKSLDKLAEIYRAIEKLDDKNTEVSHWKKLKLEACKNLMIACSGLWLEARTDNFYVVAGEKISVTIDVLLRNSCDVHLKDIYYYYLDVNEGLGFRLNKESTISNPLVVNQMKTERIKDIESFPYPYNDPYWLQNPYTNTMYVVDKQELIGLPINPIREKVTFHVVIAGIDLSIEKPIVYKYTDPVKGEIYRPLEVLPPATVNISDKVLFFNELKPKEVSFVVKANQDNFKGKININVPFGWSVSMLDSVVTMAKKGEERLIKATITPNSSAINGQLSVSVGGNIKSITRIEYDHIPYQFFLSDATAKLVFADLKRTTQKIGYIAGAGDEIVACLEQIGYDVTLLTDELLEKEDLSVYASIVTGVRAYNVNKRMPMYYDKLMKYVENGGNLIVQYNTNNRLAPLKDNIGPFPFTISTNRVTDETAKVTFSNPKHAVLNYPNKITEQDFDGWIQERGVYFATDIDKNYETIFTMNDPSEKSQNGSLIIGQYGKGNFVYTGLVFFRELPAGISGAYRLFVNLLELPKR